MYDFNDITVKSLKEREAEDRNVDEKYIHFRIIKQVRQTYYILYLPLFCVRLHPSSIISRTKEIHPKVFLYFLLNTFSHKKRNRRGREFSKGKTLFRYTNTVSK